MNHYKAKVVIGVVEEVLLTAAGFEDAVRQLYRQDFRAGTLERVLCLELDEEET